MRIYILFIACFALLISCNNNPEQAVINPIDLKRGSVISCGPQEGEVFGSVSFNSTVPSEFQNDFNTAIAFLHSF